MNHSLDPISGILSISSADRSEVACSLVVAGDWAPRGEHAQAVIVDPEGYYDALLPILREADIAMVNLEGVLGDKGSPIQKDGPTIQLSEHMIEGLAAIPFDLACLANNHSMDLGPLGLENTQKYLAERGISWIGAGLTAEDAIRPYISDINGVQLAILNAADGEEGRFRDGIGGVAPLNTDQLIRQIAELRNQVDVIVVVLHGGREYLPVPPPYLQRCCHSLIDAGADVIVGHHPHVPQGIELYRDRPIVYSLGNFGMRSSADNALHHKGYLVTCRFTSSQVHSIEVHPYNICVDGLVLMNDDERAEFFQDLGVVSTVLKEQKNVEMVWSAYADRWLKIRLEKEIMVLSTLLLGDDALLAAMMNRLKQRNGLRTLWVRRALRLIWGLNGEPPTDASSSRQLGYAILRNRFETQAHRELYQIALERSLDSRKAPLPAWTFELLERWNVFSE